MLRPYSPHPTNKHGGANAPPGAVPVGFFAYRSTFNANSPRTDESEARTFQIALMLVSAIGSFDAEVHFPHDGILDLQSECISERRPSH